MEKLIHTLVHSLKDTAELFPFLLIVYFLIELLEYKNVFKFEKSRLLTGKSSPLIGSCFGIIPQCGFSVISAELFSERKMSMAALISVFLATSDEAFPILISNYKSIPTLLFLILVKFVIALIVGYFVLFLSSKIFKNNVAIAGNLNNHNYDEHNHEHNEHNHEHNEHNHEHNEHSHEHDEHNHEHDEHNEHSHNGEEHKKHEEHNETEKALSQPHLHACCHHDINEQSKFNWKHPIIHSIKITFYIFIVNFILTGLIEFIGEENIFNFLKTNSFLQPILALLVGFIPNCASSVIITELFMSRYIKFGALITGLCANAGIGIFVLFKSNKNFKENLFIVATIIISSLIFGYIFQFIPLDFLYLD